MRNILIFALFTCILNAQPIRYYAKNIPMRDGRFLAADVYTTDTTVAKPVILIQTPYNKAQYRLLLLYADVHDTTTMWNFASYNVVTVDWRGFYASIGAYVAGYNRGLDGYDCVEWIATQSFSNGRIGTYGGSALGAIQYQTALEHPPHLICCAPYIKDFKSKYSDYYTNGVLRYEHTLSLDSLGFLSFETIVSRPLYDAIWEYVEISSNNVEEFDVPMLLASGYFDHFPDDILRAFSDLRAYSHPSVAGMHKLIMGPWLHTGIGALNQGELSFPEAENYNQTIEKKFFDSFLRDADNDYLDLPVTSYFVMGQNEWRACIDLLAMEKNIDTFFLHEGETLSRYRSPACIAPATYNYDPHDISPTYGGARMNVFDSVVVAGPVDIAYVIESREDCLLFTTSSFTSSYEICGKIHAHIFASTNRRDTDFTVRICDVYPDGRSIILTDGIARARLRFPYAEETFITPGEVFSVDIEMPTIAHVFLANHRLRLVITSSNFPKFDRNLNNGNEMYVEGDTLVAENSIYFTGTTCSYITFERPISVNINTSPNETQTTHKATVFPNPFNATLFVDAPKNTEIAVYDIAGKQVAQLANGVNTWTPESNLGCGVYFLRITNETISTWKRINYIK